MVKLGLMFLGLDDDDRAEMTIDIIENVLTPKKDSSDRNAAIGEFLLHFIH